MSIVVRNMARVVLPDNLKLEVLSMYSHTALSGSTIVNYKYNNGVAYLPLNPLKLQSVVAITGQQAVDERSLGAPLTHAFELSPSFSLRPHQQVPAPKLLSVVRSQQYAVIQAGCGLGKTSVMTWVAGQLGVKILILVDMGSLQSQWAEAFEMVWNRKVHVLKNDSQVFGDICVATFQLLHFNPDLVNRIKKEFGCLLLDEFHSTQCETRREIMFKMDNRYRIGCTATPYKKNYSDEVLSDLVADVCVVMKDSTALKAKIYKTLTNVRFKSDDPDQWGKIQKELAADKHRILFTASLAAKLCMEGRKVLVVGITAESLQWIESFIKKVSACKPRVYVGSTSLKQDQALRDDVASGLINCVLTCKKADKGLDIPALDALILAKPANNKAFVTQITGRIVRKLEGKPDPVVYDLVDSGKLAERFFSNRCKWYNELQYEILLDN